MAPRPATARVVRASAVALVALVAITIGACSSSPPDARPATTRGRSGRDSTATTTRAG